MFVSKYKYDELKIAIKKLEAKVNALEWENDELERMYFEALDEVVKLKSKKKSVAKKTTKKKEGK